MHHMQVGSGQQASTKMMHHFLFTVCAQLGCLVTRHTSSMEYAWIGDHLSLFAGGPRGNAAP
jgi:hypothetical protein